MFYDFSSPAENLQPANVVLTNLITPNSDPWATSKKSSSPPGFPSGNNWHYVNNAFPENGEYNSGVWTASTWLLLGNLTAQVCILIKTCSMFMQILRVLN